MSPEARVVLHEYAERIRARQAKERPPKQPWTTADKTDAAVGGAVIVALFVCLVLGL